MILSSEKWCPAMLPGRRVRRSPTLEGTRHRTTHATIVLPISGDRSTTFRILLRGSTSSLHNARSRGRPLLLAHSKERATYPTLGQPICSSKTASYTTNFKD